VFSPEERSAKKKEQDKERKEKMSKNQNFGSASQKEESQSFFDFFKQESDKNIKLINDTHKNQDKLQAETQIRQNQSLATLQKTQAGTVQKHTEMVKSATSQAMKLFSDASEEEEEDKKSDDGNLEPTLSTLSKKRRAAVSSSNNRAGSSSKNGKKSTTGKSTSSTTYVEVSWII
jgi:hypothetical protein